MHDLHKYYYGYIKNMDNIVEQVDVICEFLDSDEVFPNSRLLLLETSAQETKLGLVRDRTRDAGIGICQFDKVGFNDTLNRCQDYRESILDRFGININLVQWKSLRYNIFLSFLFCRLKYKLVPSPIPNTTEERWDYYKKWFNSYDGAAKRSEYIESGKYVKELL